VPERARPIANDSGSVHQSDGLALEITDLRIETAAAVEVVDEVSFHIARGEVLALVGESGCGKTSVALAALAYTRPGLKIVGGTVRVDGVELTSLNRGGLRRLRGSKVAYVPQDPAAALNPRHRVGHQVLEALVVHGSEKAEAELIVPTLFEEVGLPTDREFLARYPFELSGGQQQRVLIAAALAQKPSVVVLDEPTTGLDVLTQQRILELVGRLSDEHQIAYLYVTHDLAVVEQLADRVAVMYSGRLVECGPRDTVLHRPSHPYTTLLMQSVPQISVRRELVGIAGAAAPPGHRPEGCFFAPRCPSVVERCRREFPPEVVGPVGSMVRCWRPSELESRPSPVAEYEGAQRALRPVLQVQDLTASYDRRGDQVAVRGLSFEIGERECVALVGETGSGKTTLARCLAGLHRVSTGTLLLEGEPLQQRAVDRGAQHKQAIQLVFQNPDRSLNPSIRIASTLAQPLLLFGICGRSEVRSRAASLLDRVHLPRHLLDAYPHELSGGQKQRVAIARALAADPKLLICDEVTSALDVSIQAGIVRLLNDLRRAKGLAILFITHNLALVNSLADRTLVLRNGDLVEAGPTRQVLTSPHDPYTRALRDSAPELDVYQSLPQVSINDGNSINMLSS
jgi:peptide/nickel transport system ATP-binding protein